MFALLFLPVALAGRRPDLPPGAQAWVDRLRAAYAHYERVGFTFTPQARTGLACPDATAGPPASLLSNPDTEARSRYDADPKGFVAACEATRSDGWELWADLHPRDRRVFNALRIRVTPLPPGLDATTALEQAVTHGATASKGFHVVVPVDGYFVEEVGSCAVGAMFLYEAHDLVTGGTDRTPDEIAWSACGEVHFELRPSTWLADEAAKDREFWGLHFPEARDSARKVSADEAAPD